MFTEDFVKNTLTPILAIVGAVFGLFGTGIGIFNLYLSWQSHWVRISLSWKSSKDGPRGNDPYVTFGTDLTVVNRSYFAVTVKEAGVILKDSWYARGKRQALYGRKQTRIEPRDAFTFHTVVGPQRVESHGWGPRFAPVEQCKNATKAYVLLADDRMFILRRGLREGFRVICKDINDYEQSRSP